MRCLTAAVLAVLLCVCASGPFSAYAKGSADEADVVTTSESPVSATPDPSVTPSLVAPPDLTQFVEERYAGDLIAEVNSAAIEFGVPVELLWEVIRMESHFHHVNPATGQVKSHGIRIKGKVYYVVGICQIMIDGTDMKQPFINAGESGLYDRATNIRCMARMFQVALFDPKYEYGLERALGWYNSGHPIINSYARTIARAYRAWVIKEGGTPL